MRIRETALALLVTLVVGVGVASADPFPTEAGVDSYPSTTATFVIQFENDPQLGPMQGQRVRVSLSGPTDIARDGAVEVPGGLDTIDTEIISMELTNGMITLNESSTQDSTGQIRELTDGGNTEVGSFPAESFFDVFFEVEMPGLGTLFNLDPVYMYSIIHEIPPDPTTDYFGAGWRNEGTGGDFGFDAPLLPTEHLFEDDWLPLYMSVGGPVVAWLVEHPTHQVPVPGAVVLGAIGLGLVGWVRRKLA